MEWRGTLEILAVWLPGKRLGSDAFASVVSSDNILVVVGLYTEHRSPIKLPVPIYLLRGIVQTVGCMDTDTLCCLLACKVETTGG